MYIKYSIYGLGKVVYESERSYLVYFFNANPDLHDGVIHSGEHLCEGNHGYWFFKKMIDSYKINTPLHSFIERRRECGFKKEAAVRDDSCIAGKYLSSNH